MEGYVEEGLLGLSTEVEGRILSSSVTRDLLCLEQCTPLTSQLVNPLLSSVKTPLRFRAWERTLAQHPDGEFAGYVLRGIAEGFRIGYSRASWPCESARRNMQSAKENSEVVRGYLEEEMAAGRVVGPLEMGSVQGVQISPFGVIPKSQPGKWRLIVDLSSPQGKSVNDGIRKEWCSLVYTSVDDVVKIIRGLGCGALMAKVDIKAAYRMVPVHPDDRYLLGMQWDGKLYIDTALPFGLCSAPKIFNALADAIEWVLCARGVKYVRHYLDDFILLGPAGTNLCTRDVEMVLDTFQELGVPVAENKLVGPSTCITFLGIEIDSVRMKLRLPEDKLERVKTLVAEWRGQRSCRKRELESLIGHLSHACKVVRPGRRVLSGMIQLLAIAKKPFHYIRLNEAFRGDLEWWHAFLGQWNGVSMLFEVQAQNPQIEIWSDASGGWGCAAIWDGQWFQIQWSDFPNFADTMIAAKELLPIVVAAAVWGRYWAGCTVRCMCDNEAVVSVIRTGSCKEGHMAHMLRCLFFLEARFGFVVVSAHVPGSFNTWADALSRNHLDVFHSLAPQASPTPIHVPSAVVEGLSHTRSWISPSWTKWFDSISTQL